MSLALELSHYYSVLRLKIRTFVIRNRICNIAKYTCWCIGEQVVFGSKPFHAGWWRRRLSDGAVPRRCQSHGRSVLAASTVEQVVRGAVAFFQARRRRRRRRLQDLIGWADGAESRRRLVVVLSRGIVGTTGKRRQSSAWGRGPEWLGRYVIEKIASGSHSARSSHTTQRTGRTTVGLSRHDDDVTQRPQTAVCWWRHLRWGVVGRAPAAEVVQ